MARSSRFLSGTAIGLAFVLAWVCISGTQAGQPGRHSFAELGLSKDGLLDGPSAEVQVVVNLPGGVAGGQPGSTGVAVAVHAVIEGLQGLRSRAYLEGSWEGQTFLQLKLAPGSQLNGQPLVEWSSVDLVNGFVRGWERSDQLDFSFSNYPPFGAARPGRNVLNFRLTGPGASNLTAAVAGDSFIATEYPPPADIKIDSATRIGGPAGSKVSVRLRQEGEPAKWLMLNVWSGVNRRAGELYVPGPGDGTISISIEPSSRELAVMVSHPGGDALPIRVANRRTWWALPAAAVPWSWVLVTAFPVFWLSASALWGVTARRWFRMFALAVIPSAALTASSAVDIGKSEHLPWLPWVTPTDLQRVQDVVADDSGFAGPDAQVLKKEEVALVTVGGRVVGYAVDGSCGSQPRFSGIARGEPAEVWVIARACP